MGMPNVTDVLASFCPSLDFCAITHGDGRVKIWDTVKGHVQTEFADLTSAHESDLTSSLRNGHLSLDYTCMKWIALGSKGKKNIGSSLLILGTGSGDVVALDVAAGHFKWRIDDCHPGGVNSISFGRQDSCVYTAGFDGVVCQIDGITGNLLGKFKASTKAVSAVSLSSDGKKLATATGQIKVFSCSEFKKIKKFSGHPVSVRSMIFTDDGNYLLSCATGERYITIWKLDDSQKRHSSCLLSMEYPAVSIDSKGAESKHSKDAGLFVLAITETGLCYFWHGRNIEELNKKSPSKISLLYDGQTPRSRKKSLPFIFSARFHSVGGDAAGAISIAYGSIVKPTFEKLQVQHGMDVNLSYAEDGVLLTKHQPFTLQKAHIVHAEATTKGRANAEDATNPVPKIYDFQSRKRKHSLPQSTSNAVEIVLDNKSDGEDAALQKAAEDNMEMEEDVTTVCMEDKLKSLGIIDKNNLTDENLGMPILNSLNFKSIADAESLIPSNLPPKKIKTAVLTMDDAEAFKLLETLMAVWKSRAGSGKDLLPWISTILLYHGNNFQSRESSHVLRTLFQMTRSKYASMKPLLQLSGRLQLIMAQFDRADQTATELLSSFSLTDESGNEDEVDEYVYGMDVDESLSSSGEE